MMSWYDNFVLLLKLHINTQPGKYINFLTLLKYLNLLVPLKYYSF